MSSNLCSDTLPAAIVLLLPNVGIAADSRAAIFHRIRIFRMNQRQRTEAADGT